MSQWKHSWTLTFWLIQATDIRLWSVAGRKTPFLAAEINNHFVRYEGAGHQLQQSCFMKCYRSPTQTQSQTIVRQSPVPLMSFLSPFNRPAQLLAIARFWFSLMFCQSLNSLVWYSFCNFLHQFCLDGGFSSIIVKM